MASIITCEHCNRDYNVAKLPPGSRIRCKECGRALTVPFPEVFRCVSCEAPFKAKGIRVGVRFRCTRCRTLMEVGEDGSPFLVEDAVAAVAAGQSAAVSGNGPTQVQRPQDQTPPPVLQRSTMASDPTDPLVDLCNRASVLAAHLVESDGLRIASHASDEVDPEIIANAAVMVRTVSTSLRAMVGAKNSSRATLGMGDCTLHILNISERTLALLTRNGRYDGSLDSEFIRLMSERVQA